MTEEASLSPQYFEDLYAASEDPWSFATSAYEKEKYDRSLQALAPRYARALEIGCSIGVFTRRLAERCEELDAIDVSERALAQARPRCADRSNVRFARNVFPHESPRGPFDLITCCEVAYYWSDADLELARDRTAELLPAGNDLLLVHWLPRVDEYVRDGDAAHRAFLDDDRFVAAFGARTDRYRLDLLRRA